MGELYFVADLDPLACLAKDLLDFLLVTVYHNPEKTPEVSSLPCTSTVAVGSSLYSYISRDHIALPSAWEFFSCRLIVCLFVVEHTHTHTHTHIHTHIHIHARTHARTHVLMNPINILYVLYQYSAVYRHCTCTGRRTRIIVCAANVDDFISPHMALDPLQR